MGRLVKDIYGVSIYGGNTFYAVTILRTFIVLRGPTQPSVQHDSTTCLVNLQVPALSTASIPKTFPNLRPDRWFIHIHAVQYLGQRDVQMDDEPFSDFC